MNFYQLWNETRNMKIDDKAFMNEFLNASDISRNIFVYGSEFDNKVAVELLESLSINDFISNAKYVEDKKISSSDIIQFSNYNHGIIDLCNVLAVDNRELTFEEIGYRLIGSKTELAKKKYGENHSKLALECDFVYMKKQGSYYVGLSNLGKYICQFDEISIKKIASKLIIRNPFILMMIKQLLLNGQCKYLDFCENVLSEKTAMRRKPNVKYVITEILKDSQYSELLNEIIW